MPVRASPSMSVRCNEPSGTWIATAIAVLLIAACGNLDKDPTAKWDAERLYAEAKELLQAGNWSQARGMLEKLESRYPFGRHAQQAQMEIAYTYYKEGESAQAITAADRFLKPVSEPPEHRLRLVPEGTGGVQRRSRAVRAAS